ncbi:MAG: tRNA (N(6)-L-threonylcarbamoyladenosine(37)-C(2))-methylthiotransferase [Candidatus Hadarchaeota archaeon]
MRVYCETFGCTMNRGDTEVMLGQLAARGHEPVADPQLADVLIVNTCAVKGKTQRKVLRRLAELKADNGKPIVVAGCLPRVDFPSVEKLGSFACITSCRAVSSIGEIVERVQAGDSNLQILEQAPCERPLMPKARGSTVSAIVAISEGCLSSCSYCSVRLARGGLKSYSPDSIAEEVRLALHSGCREIKITAQDTAAYGDDIRSDLPSLINRISSIPKDFKIRVGMMNPSFVKRLLPNLIDAYRSEKVYKFLHLPVQSGDDGVLRSMRRGYTASDFTEVVEEFRENFEDVYLCTDVIVGYPGEGEKEFRRTFELIKAVRPNKVNISRFSPMPGTEAARMPRLNGREVIKRSRPLDVLAHKIGREINSTYIGQVERALVVEAGKKGGSTARLPNYAPVVVQGGVPGDFVNVKIVGVTSTYLKGVLV